jgi:ribosomal protein S18 acetylase RimI-like enzyme
MATRSEPPRAVTPTPNRFSIRRGLPADAAFVRELGAAAFGEYAIMRPGAGDDAVRIVSRSVTLVAQDSRGSAHPAGDLLGFVVIEPNQADTSHLSAIAVLEEARGRGVGRALLRAAEKLARAAGAARIELVTADSNLAALQLFLRNGFRRTPRRTRAYPRGQRTVLLEKSL